mmetsp:Transcript_53291/g.79168  ORF Transcript_53291/g.79168 Transcript_53291/m.79168 type:complete len:487 (+) Transcript_53291:115-1575(+)|eukprot:CAMPEP_0195520278 /NCGR_PEP_ID=MMETSP0794_2-20130614/16520_1 /TAXON_ID=515487 /ORGANISM="Stephanopyxis turris, Strain CCMP 815" /LENGTH=486 /DNA_ID=CAMNT_0040649603 /DNA_START=115 /DNA_END=1575 /DNA_ORIENTATION=+
MSSFNQGDPLIEPLMPSSNGSDELKEPQQNMPAIVPPMSSSNQGDLVEGREPLMLSSNQGDELEETQQAPAAYASSMCNSNQDNTLVEPGIVDGVELEESQQKRPADALPSNQGDALVGALMSFHKQGDELEKPPPTADASPMYPSNQGDVLEVHEPIMVSPNQGDELEESQRKPPADAGVVSVEDLTDLIKAIKFAHADFGARRVHREIVEVASTKEPVLADVKLGDVKKVWKKLGLSDHHQKSASDVLNSFTVANRTIPSAAVAIPVATKETQQVGSDEDDDVKNGANVAKGDEVLKMYTVGDGNMGSVIADYNKTAEETVAEAEAEGNLSNSDSRNTKAEDWTHFFLDIPADRTGQKPHQALINFNENKKAKKRILSSSIASVIKGKSKSNSTPPAIVKIQVASGGIEVKVPLLLYNLDRTAKTFIHPDAAGYDRIHRLIVRKGLEGALGKAGGMKAYFYCRILLKHKVVSIDCSGMAPDQPW